MADVVVVSVSVLSNSAYEPLLPANSENMADLQARNDNKVLQGIFCKDASECWFEVRNVESSMINEPAGRIVLKFSIFLKEGCVEYVLDPVDDSGLPCFTESSVFVSRGKEIVHECFPKS